MDDLFGLKNPQPSFVEQLRQAVANLKPSDPWSERLRKLRGRVGNDGVERLSTDAIYEALDLSLFQRTPEAGKRIKAILLEIGWTPVRSRHVTSNGHASRVRGYARAVGKRF